MLESLVDFSIRRSGLVLLLSALICAVGGFLLPKLPIDAVPDVTNVQVVVLTEAAGLSAEEMERFVTFPVEMGLNGLPELDELRSVTRSGLSAVTVVFKESMDIWFARQIVSERFHHHRPGRAEAVRRPLRGRARARSRPARSSTRSAASRPSIPTSVAIDELMNAARTCAIPTPSPAEPEEVVS